MISCQFQTQKYLPAIYSHCYDTSGTSHLDVAARLQNHTLVVNALAAIGWVMRWLARADFRIFVWYRMALGALLVLAIGLGVG